MNPWYAKSYRRNLVDMHIDDWDETFLSRLDPAEYVRQLQRAQVQSAMVYANSHVGLCNWPTRTGRMHRGLRGRDVFGEIVAECHRVGIDVVAYYSLIFNNWACAEHPEWQIRDADGRAARDQPGRLGRYGTVCPNQPAYRRFVEAQVAELCEAYAFEGLFYDMTFWPAACYCAVCRERYAREVGGEIPTTVNWSDPVWVGFQRARETWIAGFAAFASRTALRLRPGLSIEHNSSVYTAGWRLATNLGLVDANTYLGGDLYGGFDEQSFVCKLYETLTPRRPFEFMTSRCHPNLGEHTQTKPRELLEQQVHLALAHGGAFLFIDAIDPVGTLNPIVYERMGQIFAGSRAYEPFLGGERCEDLAIYFSFDSKFDPAEDGKRATAPGLRVPHRQSALALTRALREQHLPFGVITRRQLGALDRHGAILLPGSLALDAEELAALVRFVEEGGGLYASEEVPDGLAELLGIDVHGEVRGMSYLTPAPGMHDLFPEIDPSYPLSLASRQLRARAREPESVVATLTLPYTDPGDGRRLASIHSDPPGVRTDDAAVVRRRVGQGIVVWTAGALHAVEQPAHQRVFAALVRSLAREPLGFESDAHPSVEITLYRHPDGRLRLNLVNLQPTLPPVPLHDVRVRVRTDGSARRALLLPDETPLALASRDAYSEVVVPELRSFAMVALDGA